MKLKESMNQAVTKVNDVGPVIFNVAKADVAHKYGRQYYFSRKWQERDNFVGVLDDGMIQDGLFVNLGDLHCSATRVERCYENRYFWITFFRKSSFLCQFKLEYRGII